MANRIKGITVEIGGDTTKLSKALEGVNKDIKGTQTQLKDVQKPVSYTHLDVYKRQAIGHEASVRTREINRNDIRQLSLAYKHR